MYTTGSCVKACRGSKRTKQYVRECSDEDAPFRTTKSVRYLAVQKPFEINHEDTPSLKSIKKDGASKAGILEMAEGVGDMIKKKREGRNGSESQSLFDV